MKKEKVLISVVVPAYNEEKNIGRCLASLKKQNFPQESYEIIVVNNVSTDKTGEIAKKMGVKVVFEPKKGVSFALKKGFETARADFVAAAEADTVVPKDWLFNIYKAFKKDKDVVLVGGRTVYRPLFPLALVAQFVLNFIAAYLLKIFPTYAMAFRRDAYQKAGGIDTRINFNGDTDLCLRLKKQGRVVFLYHNPIVVSSRHYRGIEGLKYSLKGPINAISLILFKKAPFFHFSDIRE